MAFSHSVKAKPAYPVNRVLCGVFSVHDSEQSHATQRNHRRWRRLGDGRDGESVGFVKPRDQVGVDHGSRGSVVFAERASAGELRYEEVVAQQSRVRRVRPAR
jgi:hypothetical protein